MATKESTVEPITITLPAHTAALMEEWQSHQAEATQARQIAYAEPSEQNTAWADYLQKKADQLKKQIQESFWALLKAEFPVKTGDS